MMAARMTPSCEPMPEVAREFADYRMLIFGLVMVLMMIWRPEGQQAAKAHGEVLHGQQGARFAARQAPARGADPMSHDPKNAPDSARKPGPQLALQDLTMRFGGLLAVDGVSPARQPYATGRQDT